MAANKRACYVNVEQNDDGTAEHTAAAPPDCKGHSVATTVTASVRPIRVRSGVATEGRQILDLVEVNREGYHTAAIRSTNKSSLGVRRRLELTVLGVLEQNGGGCADLSDEFVVVALDVDVFVDELAVDGGVFGSIVEVVGAIIRVSPVTK